MGQILLLQHRVEHVAGSTAHCDICVTGKALEHAASPTVLPLPPGSWTGVDPFFEPRRATRADALPPKARGPPETATA